MRKSVTLMLLLLYCSSCEKKKSDETITQRTDNYIEPASEDEIDTTQTYISPSDAFSDHSVFDPASFQPAQIRYRGTRKLTYHILTPQTGNNNLIIAVEYLSGTGANNDTTPTVSRILLYSKNALVFRKAFPIEFVGAVKFSSTRKFNHVIFNATPSKAIIYYWFTVTKNNRIDEKKYFSICIDKEGIVSELSGDLTRIGGNFMTVRFLDPNWLTAKVSPNARYPYLSIDIAFSIDWNTCTATLDVPADTIFTVSDHPFRYFNNKIKLHDAPAGHTQFRETNFRRLTQAQMQRIFAPSFLDINAINRDRLFIEFNRTTKGWLNYETMIFEEIVSEN